MSKTESWSPKRIAQMLHASLDEVTQAIERRDLKANRVGNEYVITRAQLDAFTRRGNPFARRRAGPSDEELLTRAQSGDPAAFEQLEARYRPKIWAFCKYVFGDSEQARDLTQETLLTVFLDLSKFDGSRSSLPLIMRIAANTCRDRLRTLRGIEHDHQRSLEEPRHGEVGQATTLSAASASPDLDPQQQMEGVELHRAMEHCLKDLRPLDRLAIWARFYDDQTYHAMMSELTAMTDCGTESVVDQALQRLRDCLRDRGYEAL